MPKVQRPVEVDPDSSRELGASGPSDLKEDSGEEREACVGVHFGTTHTAVAYIVRGGVDFPSSSTETLASVQDVEAIQIIPEWPGHSKAQRQMSTKLYYQNGEGLQNLRGHIESQIRGQYSDQCALKFRYAVGVPAHWPSDAKRALLDCVVKAEMGGTAKNLVALPELEAATMGALYDLGLAVTTGDVLMVCDAGGGTVDLCTYECTYQQGQAGILRPLAWNSTEADGSAHIYPQLYDRLPEAALDNALREFEDGKRPRTRSQSRMMLWNDGVPGQVGGVRKVLDVEVEAISMLVSEHIGRVRGLKSGGVEIKMLLLVGIFGQNQSLIQELTKVCRDAGNIQVHCHHWFKDAVARGLALHLVRDEDEKLREVTIETVGGERREVADMQLLE
jgi:hypothetical protein